MAEETGPYLIAKTGERVTCEVGHEICYVDADILSDSKVSAKHFANFSWDYKPEPGTHVPNCPRCGARFLMARPIGGAVVHIDNEWRGKPDILASFLAERAN